MALVAAAAGVGYRIPFGGSVQMQYASDVGEAFVRASEAEYEGAPVHNLDGPVVSSGVIELIERLRPRRPGRSPPPTTRCRSRPASTARPSASCSAGR